MAVAAPTDLIPFHKPSIGEAEIEAVAEVMRSGWLTTGPKCIEFEQRFADYLGVTHAVAVNSATAALHLALEAFGVGPGDEVVVPTYTFTACGEVVRYLGAELVLADVGDDYLIGPEQVEPVLTEATKAIMPVHFAGRMCDVTGIRQLSSAKIIEDGAHTRPIVMLGDAAAFSFYATKTLTTGEGGMLTTDDDQIAARARFMRIHGIAADAFYRNRLGQGAWAYEVLEAGFKYNLTDIAAAIGLVQLDRLDEMTEKRAWIAGAYDEAFAGTEIGRPPHSPSNHLYVIRVSNRDKVIRKLADEGIGASVHFIPLHLHPYYQRLGYRPGQFPVAEKLYRSSISLPIWPDMTEGQVEQVSEAVLAAVR